MDQSQHLSFSENVVPRNSFFRELFFAIFLLCAISCLPSLHGPLILEKLFALDFRLDFRVFCVF